MQRTRASTPQHTCCRRRELAVFFQAIKCTHAYARSQPDACTTHTLCCIIHYSRATSTSATRICIAYTHTRTPRCRMCDALAHVHVRTIRFRRIPSTSSRQPLQRDISAKWRRAHSSSFYFDCTTMHRHLRTARARAQACKRRMQGSTVNANAASTKTTTTQRRDALFHFNLHTQFI